MSFDSIEKSRTKGRPVNLFLLRYGTQPNSYYAYTDATSDIARGGVTYQSVAIVRGAIVVKGNMDKASLEVRMAMSLPAAELFRVYPPANVITLTISQGHLGDPDNEFLVAWAGRVTSAKRETPELVLTCEPHRTSMKRLGLRRHYQYSCAHVLYGPHCRANKAAATTSRSVVAVLSSMRIQLPAGWNTLPVANYVGGMIEWTTPNGEKEVRSIIRISGEVLTLSGMLNGLAAGDTVSVIRGCSRNLEGCGTHNNVLNFGGCPFIPKKNPVGRLNMFY